MLDQKIREIIETLMPDERYSLKHPQGLLISRRSGYDGNRDLTPAHCAQIVRKKLNESKIPYATYAENTALQIEPRTNRAIPSGFFLVFNTEAEYNFGGERLSITTRIEELIGKSLTKEEKEHLFRMHGSTLWFNEPTAKNQAVRVSLANAVYNTLRSEGWAAFPVRDNLKYK